MYRVGFPFWKAAARAGVPVKLRVLVHRDAESNTYWAESHDLDGLVASGATLDELQREVLSAATLLLELSMSGAHANVTADIKMREHLPCAA